MKMLQIVLGICVFIASYDNKLDNVEVILFLMPGSVSLPSL